MDAVAKSNMSKRLAADVEAVRLIPLPRVTVRSREEQDHLLV
jgi:hypothetical protein